MHRFDQHDEMEWHMFPLTYGKNREAISSTLDAQGAKFLEWLALLERRFER